MQLVYLDTHNGWNSSPDLGMEPILSVVSLIDSYFTVLLSVSSQHFTYTLQPLVSNVIFLFSDAVTRDLPIFTVPFKPRSTFWRTVLQHCVAAVGVFLIKFIWARRASCVAALRALFRFTSRWQQKSSSFFLLCWRSKVLIQVRKAISSALSLRWTFALHLYVVFR